MGGHGVTIVCVRSVDTETTGLAPPEAELLEIGFSDVVFDTDTKVAVVHPGISLLFMPERGIPVETQAIHHLRLSDLAGQPVCTAENIRAVATSDMGHGAPGFLAAHGADFDRQWFTDDLCGGLHWIDTHKCALRLYDASPSKSNACLKYFLGFEDLDHALCMPSHRAAPDAYVTGHILARMLETEMVRDLVKWTMEPKFYSTCPLGKWKGSPWPDIEFSYLQWICKAQDMDPDVVAAARAEMTRRQDHHT
jgi:exodeoxyribonuclease X